jgi:hypothetical protein
MRLWCSMVAPISLSPFFTDRQWLTGEHGFIHGAAPFQHSTVHRHFFTGTHTQLITDMNMRQRNIFFATISIDATRRFRCKPNKDLIAADVWQNALSIPEFAQQGQGNNHYRSFKIDAHTSHRLETGRKPLRRNSSCHAVEKSSAGAVAISVHMLGLR